MKKKIKAPVYTKNVKYDSKVKEAHFKTVKNHLDIDSCTNTLHKMFFLHTIFKTFRDEHKLIKG